MSKKQNSIENSNNKDDEKIEVAEKSTVKYSGSVVIKYKSKNGKLHTIRKHNSGRMGLYTFIAYSLAGYNASLFIPKYIMCFYKSGSDELNALNNVVAKTGTPYITPGDSTTNPVTNPKITYCFEIPYNNLSQKTQPITRICLVNDYYKNNQNNNTVNLDTDGICADIDLEEQEEEIPTNSESNIVIYWTLTFNG